MLKMNKLSVCIIGALTEGSENDVWKGFTTSGDMVLSSGLQEIVGLGFPLLKNPFTHINKVVYDFVNEVSYLHTTSGIYGFAGDYMMTRYELQGLDIGEKALPFNPNMIEYDWVTLVKFLSNTGRVV